MRINFSLKKSINQSVSNHMNMMIISSKTNLKKNLKYSAISVNTKYTNTLHTKITDFIQCVTNNNYNLLKKNYIIYLLSFLIIYKIKNNIL